MEQLSDQQEKQENKYAFPYHYIPKWDGYKFSQTQNLSWGYEYLSYLHFVLEKASQIGFNSLLDVGCGDGRLLYELSRRFSDRQLVGLDYSQRAINLAKIMVEAEVKWVCGDVRDENLFDNKFDIITLVETLEHIKPDEIEAFLRAIDNNLAEDGSFIITVPSKNLELKKAHYQHFDLNSLKGILSPIFSVSEVIYINHRYSRFIKKVLTNKIFILKHKKILRWLYNYYTKHLFVTDAVNCRRMAVICKKSTK